MNNVDLDRYYEDIFSLVRTMVIKINAVAERDNQLLADAGYPISDDKRTWRYYMNMNGDYHPTDDIMTIFSIDTGEEIVFDKANLELHPVTFREYNRGTYWYKRLIETYPHQSGLIRGILSPIPYSETIEAEDYKILRYNKDLVEWNETQLIPKLQRFVNADVKHLLDTEYVATDNLWLPLMIEQLYADLIKAIHAIRLEDAYTRHTHSFFIWSHIDSYGNFSQYKNSLNNEQVMWLFRNIAWIKNNPGQRYTFDKLIHNLLTKANIPIAEFDMVATTENQLEDLTLKPLYRRLQLNLKDEYGRVATFADTTQLLRKEEFSAKENPHQMAYYLRDAEDKGTHSLHSELKTKVLESSMSDYTNRHADTLMSVVFNEWIYLAGLDIFRGSVVVVDPKTGNQKRVGVKEAYHLWTYLVEIAKGNEPVYICPVHYKNVLKFIPPSLSEIADVGGPKFISKDLALTIRNEWFPVAPFFAPDYIIQYAFDVYKVMWNHKKLYSQYFDLNKRARVKNATSVMYDTGVAKLTDYQTYSELLEVLEYDFSEYTQTEARNFAWDIFKRVTGWDTNAQPSIRVKQNDLINIMMKLSSYTVQTVTQMEDGLGVTELINEFFVGDSRPIGVGNASLGDFSNVMFNHASNFGGEIGLRSTLLVVDKAKPKFVVETKGEAIATNNDVFKPHNISSNLRDTAIKFPNNNYFRLLPEE